MNSRIWRSILSNRNTSVSAAVTGGSVIYYVTDRRFSLGHGSRTARLDGVVATREKPDQSIEEGDHAATTINKNNRANFATSLSEQKERLRKVDDDDGIAWASFFTQIAAVRESLSSIQWSSLADRMSDFVLPDWVQDVPGQVNKLQTELTMAPGSLADEIWQEAQDPDVNPEITREARVRSGKSLCEEERLFRVRRKEHTTRALAKYLEISEDDIHPDDVPMIAMCGSGGGLRALVAGASSYLCAQEAGLFDCVTYTAGVSGSCWLQTLYYSSICNQKFNGILDHLKHRINVHIAYPPTALELFTCAPTNKFLLSGCVEKLRADPTADFGLVDGYGLLLAARLLVPRGEIGVNPLDLKVSNQRAYLSKGDHPLPIYTAVRHEIPVQLPKEEVDKGAAPESLREKAKEEAWFQWFEFTPYEMWCEELDAGVPMFSVGRRFEKGTSVLGVSGYGQPEVRVPLLMGIWGSAFCATLAHYYKELRPLVKGLVGFSGIDDLVEERNNELIKVHPIDPATIPNFAIGLDEGWLSSTAPKSIFSSERLQLMDAGIVYLKRLHSQTLTGHLGMSNNLPIYPLLRDGRNVDVLVAFDASADIESENWLSVVDGYAKQRGIKGWPTGAGWPKGDATVDRLKTELNAAKAASAQQAAGKIADAREGNRGKAEISPRKDGEIGHCNVWIGTTAERDSERESPQSKRVEPDADWKILAPDAGIALIYFPFLPNAKVDGVDPNTSDFMSTWNFIYSPEDIENVVALARANFHEGKEQTKRTIRAVYERRKAKRLKAEEKSRIRRWKHQLRESGDHFG